MKKLILMAAVALCSLSASAQWYAGGGLGFGVVSPSVGDNKTSFYLTPEVGYSFNNKWGVGLDLSVGYNKIAKQDNTSFLFAPYARWTFAKAGIASFFADGALELETNPVLTTNDGTRFGLSIKPGVALNVSKHIDLQAKANLLSFSVYDEKAGDGAIFNLDANISQLLSFYVIYKF
ncbi:MAG: porin family protein [Bacteroidaceae bacterium]|nr:porin family protein [Candidatus Equimonas faecalis]MCQ2205404.1 porin family protein [Bacteroidaceae bacterium]